MQFRYRTFMVGRCTRGGPWCFGPVFSQYLWGGDARYWKYIRCTGSNQGVQGIKGRL